MSQRAALPAASTVLEGESHRSRSRRHSELLAIPFQESYLWNVIDKNKLKKFHFDDTDTFPPLAPFDKQANTKELEPSGLRSSHKLVDKTN